MTLTTSTTASTQGDTLVIRLVCPARQVSLRQRWPLRGLMERVFSKADAINLPDYPGLSLAQQNSEVALPH